MIDYGTALLLIVVPLFFIFGGNGAGVGEVTLPAAEGATVVGETAAESAADTAAWVALVAGVLLLGMSLFTRYELGAVKRIPMRTHLMADMILGVALVVSPWVFGFADVIWWPFVVVGLAEIGVAAMTRRRSPIEPVGQPATAGGRAR